MCIPIKPILKNIDVSNFDLCSYVTFHFDFPIYFVSKMRIVFGRTYFSRDSKTAIAAAEVMYVCSPRGRGTTDWSAFVTSCLPARRPARQLRW